ncbi:MAG: precorrin-6y C5,15-methyltransferase (decarboxylating) subunit CbiE [Dehalococcoidia bacterium]|nr:precorrin-6y C5,15-methyltransferase (decarboxylating) subunit CbiE [Dehalococcoidia bacterium]
MDKNKVYIVGMLEGGEANLCPEAKRIINNADILIGSSRLLCHFADLSKTKIPLDTEINKTIHFLKSNLGKYSQVILASGDPNFFGISRTLGQQLGKEAIEIFPNLTSLQVAFARIKEPWDDAVLVSAHGRPLKSVIEISRHNNKIGILTDKINTPAAIAASLLTSGLDHFQAFVGQDLGGVNEKVFPISLKELRNAEIPSPNVVILITSPKHRKQFPKKTVLGIPDNTFHRERAGLITKMEVRVISLAKMQLAPTDVVWDIGAGSGSVAIEAAGLCKDGTVYAIEKSAKAVDMITLNKIKFGVTNMELVAGEAPEALNNLEPPDAIFIGGSGGRLPDILAISVNKLKRGGRLVLNIATLENLETALNYFRQRNLPVDITLVNIAKSRNMSDKKRFKPSNPVFVVSARKGK